MVWRYLIPAILLIAGAILGPVLIAAGQGMLASSEPDTRRGETMRLVAAYRERLPPFRLMLTIVPPDPERCGYAADSLFAKDDRGGIGSPYDGFQVLDRWKAQRSDEAYLDQVADGLSRRMSPFSTVFLRRCMEATLFGNWCESRVRSIADELIPAERPAARADERVLCTYLDGVAARAGKSLARRPD